MTGKPLSISFTSGPVSPIRPLSEKALAKLLKPEAPLPFRDDWIYLVKRLEHYQTKYKVKVKPELFLPTEEGEKNWSLQLQIGAKQFAFSQFPDPTKNQYESGMLMAGKDPELFLNDRLLAKEWNLSFRLGAFIPYTFQVLENTTPIGYVAGLEWLYLRRIWGLALEYDFGAAGIFPQELREIDSGDAVEELPLQEYLPVALRFHNVSATPILNFPFYTPNLHVHLIAGAGIFYEQGQVKEKRFDIIPVLADDTTSFGVQVDRRREDYRSFGPRGRVGATLERGAFHLGLDVLFDFGFPFNGEFQNFDQYLMRGMLSLTLGYHHL